MPASPRTRSRPRVSRATSACSCTTGSPTELGSTGSVSAASPGGGASQFKHVSGAPRGRPARSPGSCRRRPGSRSRAPPAEGRSTKALGPALGDAAGDRPHRLGVQVAVAAHQLGVGRHRCVLPGQGLSGRRAYIVAITRSGRAKATTPQPSVIGRDRGRIDPGVRADHGQRRPLGRMLGTAVAGRVPAVMDRVCEEGEVVARAVVAQPVVGAPERVAEAPRHPGRRPPGPRCTASTWMSWPLCDAHITASTRSSSPSASRPPEATSGSAWNGLAAERSVVTRPGSPQAATIDPSARTTTAWMRWRLSGKPSRSVVTRPGSDTGNRPYTAAHEKCVHDR